VGQPGLCSGSATALGGRYGGIWWRSRILTGTVIRMSRKEEEERGD